MSERAERFVYCAVGLGYLTLPQGGRLLAAWHERGGTTRIADLARDLAGLGPDQLEFIGLVLGPAHMESDPPREPPGEPSAGQTLSGSNTLDGFPVPPDLREDDPPAFSPSAETHEGLPPLADDDAAPDGFSASGLTWDGLPSVTYADEDEEPAPEPVQEPEQRILVEVVSGRAQGKRFEFPVGTTLVVGRLRKAQVCLREDPTVSRRHCVLQSCAGRARVVDLSTNGTLLNGTRIAGTAELHGGDAIQVGDSRLRVTLPEAVAPDPAPADEPETVDLELPGVTLQRLLGRGGQGRVFLAQRENGQKVAVKVIRAGGLPSTQAVRAFLGEAMRGAKLVHPHLVRLFASGFTQGNFFFVMEFVDGTNAEAAIASRGRPYSLGSGLTILKALLGALSLAHRRGLVHRDIKPTNVLIARREGGGFTPKLADFGLLRSYEGARLTYTGTGEWLGTPAFMAPEQLESAQPPGPPADVYALAATFYYLVSGRFPLDIDAAPHPLIAVMEGKRVPLRERRSDVPPGLDRFVSRCLARDPARRPADATAMTQLLETALSGGAKASSTTRFV